MLNHGRTDIWQELEQHQFDTNSQDAKSQEFLPKIFSLQENR